MRRMMALRERNDRESGGGGIMGQEVRDFGYPGRHERRKLGIPTLMTASLSVLLLTFVVSGSALI